MIKDVHDFPVYQILDPDGKVYYSIPKYQREYTWSYREWDALYDDISENNTGYFIGSIICIPMGETINPHLEVIDGQQRLTTISLLLAAIYNRLKEYKSYINEDDGDVIPSLRKSLMCKYSPNKMKLILQEQNYNRDDFDSIMTDLGLNTSISHKHPYFGNRKIARCYNHFLYLLDYEMENMEAENKVNFLLDKYQKVKLAILVKIEVYSHSDAYILFESLNNRGMPLTAIDLMKNLIMSKAESNNLTTDECFGHWQDLLTYLSDDYSTQERFFRQYYNAFKNHLNKPFRNEKDRKKDPLGTVATKSNLLNIFERLINNNLSLFLKDILECAKYYSWLILQEQDNNAFKNELEDLDHIQGAPSYVLLMYVLKYQAIFKLSDNHINALIGLLSKYFVRRNLTDYPSTRDLTRIFMNIIARIEEENPTGKEVLAVVVDELGSPNNCASDELFKKCFEGDIYKENVGAARYILCKLAESTMTKETWTDLWARNAKNAYVWTIEHIFPEGENIPQCWINMIADGDLELAKKYLNEFTHKIGNLTITGYNSTLGNKSFEEKRDRRSKDNQRFIGYKNGLDINKDIAQKEAWTIEDIKTRTAVLVDELIHTYAFPGQNWQ